MSLNILIAEDDLVLQKLICDIVKKQGYNPIPAKNGEEALDIFFDNIISMCILDVMMPIYNGWEVLESIREHDTNVPIMMLTALNDEENEVKGLKKGADDYIAKPFSYPIFIARLENIIKKVQLKEKEKIVIGDLSFCKETREVLVDEERIELNNKEYLLLEYFILNKEQVLTREKILIQIWGFDYDGDIRTVDTHVKMIRKKLHKCGDYIQTVRGVGYQFMVKS